MYPDVSKHNWNCEKQFIFSMVLKGEKTMALSCSEKSSALLRGVTSKNNRDFYCLNSLHSFRKKSHKRVRENKVYNAFSRHWNIRV